MSPSSSRPAKKTRGRILIVVIVLAVVGALYVVYRNNTEVFARKAAPQEEKTPEPGIREVVETHQGGTSAPQGRNRPVRDTAPVSAAPVVSKPDTVANMAPPRLRQSVVIPGVDCAILGSSTLKVLLSLELFFDDEALRDEILAKREPLKVMVRKVLSTKRFDEIQVEPLRAELRDSMNKMLTTGALTDIEFRAFRIQ